MQQLDVASVTGVLGEFVLLPGHEAFLTALAPGRLSYKEFGQAHHFFAGGGFLQIVNDTVRVLAESLVPVAKLDVTSVADELAQALQALRSAEDRSPEALKRLDAAVRAARAKLAVAKRRR